MPPSVSPIPRSLQYLWLGFFLFIACGGVAAAVYKVMHNPGPRITEVREEVASTLKTQAAATDDSAPGNPAPAPPPPSVYKTTPSSRIAEVRDRVSPALKTRLATDGFALGNPAFIRIVKEERELELWLRPKDVTEYKLWKKWPIAAMSGRLGPKQKRGDFQAPEGFYSTNAGLLNPNSSYHLSFNIGYPNEFDRAHGRTGDFLMVHGNQVSVGCFAMTDPVIEEIYLVVESAIRAGQKVVPVHVFPFRMTEERMTQAEADDSEWLSFWEDMREGWVKFEEEKTVPKVKVDPAKKRYVVMD